MILSCITVVCIEILDPQPRYIYIPTYSNITLLDKPYFNDDKLIPQAEILERTDYVLTLFDTDERQ